ncbi:hypothetical protein ACFFWC_05465 [Plantactinospora siamensis]|uniref:Uncharacterized protein n=1 Tax=Plantactinospora siamensis TaxID=555372 RepID=A0ABV6NRQ7_9ACTN
MRGGMMDAGRRREIERKVYAGQRLDRADGVGLAGCDDLVWLGRLAHHRRADPERAGFVLDPRWGPATDAGLAADAGVTADAGPAADARSADAGPVTVLTYGRDTAPEIWVDRLMAVRDRQDADGGCRVLVAVRAGTAPEEVATADPAAPVLALRLLALSRLLLDNVARIAVSYPIEGASLCQLALNFGVDQLLAGAEGGPEATAALREELVTLIGDAGFRPVELDPEQRVIHTYDPPPSQADRRSEPQRVWA